MGYLIKNLKDGGNGKSTNNDEWSMLIQRTITNEYSEIIETPDPTTIEFEIIFSEIMKEALKYDELKVIIVVDNLDRVSSDDAFSIWATLRTFLEHRNYNSPEWFKQLWVVIPYDPEGISRMWKGKEKNLQEKDTGFATSFLDKILQIRFFVPPPILSDYRKYLIDCLNKALPAHTESEFHIIYRLYVLSNPEPTPRDIKIFVNQVGAFHRQWGDTIPIGHMAYYVILKQNNVNIVEELRKGNLPEINRASLLGNGVQDNLAALHFNVDVQRARQIVLRKPIISALTDIHIDEIKLLAETNPGFWEIMEQELLGILNDWLENETTKIIMAVSCMIEAGVFNATHREELKAIKAVTYDMFLKITYLSQFNTNIAKGMVNITRVYEDSVLVPKMAQIISETQFKDDEKELVDAILYFLKGINAEVLKSQLKNGISLKVDVPGWLKISDYLVEKDPSKQYWDYLRITDLTEVTNNLLNTISSSAYSKSHINAIRVLSETKADIPRQEIVTAINNILLTPNAVNSSIIGLFYETLWELRSITPLADSSLTTLVNNNYSLHHLYYCIIENNHSSTAWCLIPYLSKNPATQYSTDIGQASSGKVYLDQIFSSPETYPEISKNIIEIAIQSGNQSIFFDVHNINPIAKPWVIYCLKIVAEGLEASKVFTSEIITENWQLLKSEVNEGQRPGKRFESLIVKLVESSDLIQYTCDNKFDYTHCGIYGAIVRNGGANNVSVKYCTP